MHKKCLFFLICSSAGKNQGKYVPKELKSETLSVFQSVEFCGNPAVCAIMCNHLYDIKRGYVNLLLGVIQNLRVKIGGGNVTVGEGGVLA